MGIFLYSKSSWNEFGILLETLIIDVIPSRFKMSFLEAWTSLPRYKYGNKSTGSPLSSLDNDLSCFESLSDRNGLNTLLFASALFSLRASGLVGFMYSHIEGYSEEKRSNPPEKQHRKHEHK